MFASSLGSAVLAVTQVCALTGTTALGFDFAAKGVIDGVTVSGDGALCRWHSPTQFGDAAFRFRFGRWERVYDFISDTFPADVLESSHRARLLDNGYTISEDAPLGPWTMRPSGFGPNRQDLSEFSASQFAAFAAESYDLKVGDDAYAAYAEKLHGQVVPLLHYEPPALPSLTFEPTGGETSLGPALLSGFAASLRYEKGMVRSPVRAFLDVNRSADHPDRIELSLEVGDGGKSLALAAPLAFALYGPMCLPKGDMSLR